MGENYNPIQATLCYLRYNGKVLFIQRGGGSGDIHDGYFVVPGGRTECSRPEIKCERGIDGISREFEEETGLRVIKPRLRAIVTFFNLGRKFGEIVDPEDYKVEVYEASEFTGELKSMSDSKKNKRLVWVDEEKISELNMSEGDRKLYDLLVKNPEGVFEILVKSKEGDKLERFDVARVA